MMHVGHKNCGSCAQPLLSLKIIPYNKQKVTTNTEGDKPIK